MNDILNDAARVMDLFCKPMGEYAPRVRRLVADYKDKDGVDLHQELVTMHDPKTTDDPLVDSVRESLEGRGCILTALAEVLEDGSGKALYLAPGYMEEAIRELGLPVPQDMAAAMTAAGIHPVNWEELVHER